MSNWYTKFDRKSNQDRLLCPNCSHIFDEQIIYFFDPIDCPQCHTSIGFINVSPYIQNTYVIDINAAPEIFKVIFEYLSKQNHKDGFNQMKSLIELFIEGEG